MNFVAKYFSKVIHVNLKFENTMIKLWLPCNPPTATAQQKKITRMGKTYDPPNVKAATEFLAGLLAPYAPKEPLTGPVVERVRFVFPWRPSESKKVVKAGVNVPIITKPDCDNMVKRLNDILERLRFFENDSQIYSMTIEKYRGSSPGIMINLG